MQYVLSADDYGVMRASPSVLRADNPKLEQEPIKRLVMAMHVIERSGLVQAFEHQKVKFWWQTDWQDFQNIRYPRDTVNPQPSEHLLELATDRQRKLFALRTMPSLRDSGKIPETPPVPARAGGRETLTPTLTPPGSGSLEESARGTTPPSPEVNHPRCDPATAAACARGICVPLFLAQQWRAQHDPDGRVPTVTNDILRDFVRDALGALPVGPIGDDPLKFWRAAWSARHGTQAPSATRAPQGKGAQVVAGVTRGLERYAARKAQEGRR